MSLAFLDFFAWLGECLIADDHFKTFCFNLRSHSASLHATHAGWATDLKTVSEDMIRKRAARTGDGTRSDSKVKADGNNNDIAGEKEMNHCDLWGWGKKHAMLLGFKLKKFSIPQMTRR